MITLPPPALGDEIEIVREGVSTLGTVASHRALSPGLWQLVVTHASSREVSVVVIARGLNGWETLAEAPIGAAIAEARAILRGISSRTPPTQQSLILATACLALADLPEPRAPKVQPQLQSQR